MPWQKHKRGRQNNVQLFEKATMNSLWFINHPNYSTHNSKNRKRNFFYVGWWYSPQKQFGHTSKIPEPGRRNSLLSCWQCCSRDFQNIQSVDISLGYLTSTEGKSLLLKTPCNSVTRSRDPRTWIYLNTSLLSFNIHCTRMYHLSFQRKEINSSSTMLWTLWITSTTNMAW